MGRDGRERQSECSSESNRSVQSSVEKESATEKAKAEFIEVLRGRLKADILGLNLVLKLHALSPYLSSML